MIKTTGFLLVVLLATIPIITSSFGDETDSSHLAHLTAAYGPHIASCDVCHVVPYTGMFVDGQDLVNTTVCDHCHSPGGAYDGVNGPYIGAKGNWVSGGLVSGVYDEVNGELLHSKEKWCVGCHDDGDSSVNEGSKIDGVSAPNISGDDVDYGYYKTGHGRGYGTDQPAVSCLECHDPALTHMDGAARTYTAAANNYQIGYRLKSVNGYAPLVVPRGGVFDENQFRLCFSCHESTPFLNSNYTDTNFRSDVNNSCQSLNPPANRHWFHLQAITFFRNKWDSDWDGVTADSTASCTACHNIHGPRNTPAMIRTGELIGREYSLNLEYYVNPCPDTTFLLTNETSDSTGGQNKFLGALRGTVTKNGVCNMCHNEVEPYWRTPTEITSSYTTQVDEYKDCDTCHVFGIPPTVCDGASAPDNPDIDCESCHGHDAGYEYAEGESGPLYSWGIGSDSGTLTSPSHSTHTENDEDDLQGLNLSCDACHNMNTYNNFFSGGEVLFSDGQNLANTTVCNPCHSPDGSYDGLDDPVIGARNYWDAGVYNGSALQDGKEKWCVGCHDDGDSSIDEGSKIDGIIAPNIAGNDVIYGFYKTGHGKHNNEQAITCLTCHDTTFIHVDGKARTYAAADNNYQAGYRLKWVNGQAPMVVPRPWDRWQPSDIDADQFRLCFSCHDSAPFLSSNNMDTNFRSDVNDSCETLDPQANRHWYHLQPIGNFSKTWDSDLDGANDPEKGPGKNTADSMPSCPACHNVHGPKISDGATHAPAMIRTGELIGRSSSLNLDYFTGECSDTTHSDTNELFDTTGNSTGGQMMSYGASQGSVEKNGVCQMCHMETEPYWREAKNIISCGSGNCHANPSHATHLTAEYGPHISCSDCHNTDENNFSRFSDGEDLANTHVCDTCHSPGGTYDGVDSDPETDSVGAKDNWDDGVYDGSALQAGKGKWCAGCHDGEPSVIDGVTAPNIVGDEDNSEGEGKYGGWGFYKTGHGLPGDEPYPYKGGFLEPPLKAGASRPVDCDSCHDFTTAHIDNEERTYNDGDSADTDPSVYRLGYRLKLVDGEEPLQIPWKKAADPNSAERYRLCAACHVTRPFTTSSMEETNFISYDGATLNRHYTHINNFNSNWWSADWDGTNTGRITCVTCHNVHGSTQLAMVRDGKLVDNTMPTNLGEPGLQMWYYNEDTTIVNESNSEPPDPENVPLAASDGTVWKPGSSGNLCGFCHSGGNTVKEPREPFQDTSPIPTLDWTDETGFEFDGANPDSSVSGTSFDFRVEYTDQNNYGPVSPDGYINLLIDTDCDGNADLDSPYAMEESDSGDEKYIDGKIYSRSLILTGTENSSICYKFEARNETGVDATGSPTNWSTILLFNNAPVLSWTGEEYYETDGVNPDIGGDGASFTFMVMYTDADKECPPTASDMQVWIDADDSTGNYGNGEKFDMTAVDGGDSDCSDGKLYTYTTVLSYKGDGILNYRFYATDGTDAATGGDPAADSTVTVLKKDTNTPPFLSWWDGTCVTEGVKPAYGAAKPDDLSGDPGGDFIFYIKYEDPDGCPTTADAVQVTIEGVGKFDMTGDGGDTDCTDGRVYSVSKNDLTAGTYNYYFSATDDDGGYGYGDPTVTATYEVEVVDAYKVRPAGGTGWYTKIQDAIDAARVDSKLTLVYEGTYETVGGIKNGRLNLWDASYNDSTVRSVCGPDETIIKDDGNEVVYLQNVSGVAIDGFGITSMTEDGCLTGVRSNSGSATINNCKIHDFHNTGRGGALVAGNASSIFTVTNSEIYENESDLDGGAINYNAGLGHSISNTTIHDNTAGTSGGAIWAQNASITFTDVTIRDNTAGTYGGAIYSNGADADFFSCTITGNEAQFYSGGFAALGNGSENFYMENSFVANNRAASGGVAFVNGAELIAQYSTFAYNEATNGDGGVLLHQNATSEFYNSILWGNSASNNGHNAYINGGTLTFSDSIVASGGDGVYDNLPYFVDSGAAYTVTFIGNMSEDDPMFVDATGGNYHIKDISPAIDSGTNTVPTGKTLPSEDIDGDARPYPDGDNDIGADEYLTGLNNGPTLSWTGEAGYGSDGIDPDSGNGGQTNFVFRVNYTDDEDNPPVLIQVWIDEDDNGAYGAGEKFAMTQDDDDGDSLYTNGERYTLSRVLNFGGDGTLRFKFYATDGSGEATGAPTAEQSVSLTNNIPMLTWIEDPYGNGVDPDSGQGGTEFTFRVKYTDGDNVAPDPIQVWVDTDNSGVYDAHEKYAMVQDDDDGNSDFNDGEEYTFSLVIPYIGDGAISYRFYASDGAEDATGNPVTSIDLIITPEPPGNNAPVLSWADANCLTEGVRPGFGADGTDFEFKIIYTDEDAGQCAGDILLLVDQDDSGTYESGEKYVLTGDAGDTDCSDGRLYETTLNLEYTGDGDLTYRFYAADGLEAATGTPVESDSTVTVVDAIRVRPTGGAGWLATIQAGEDNSISGDTILVYPNDDFTAATYVENIDARTTDLTIRSACGPDLTIIDGGGSNPVLIRADNQVLDGFSVTGGGVGVYINPGPVNQTIKNNKIYGNSSYGINVNTGYDIQIEKNEIYDNSIGINTNGGSTVDISDCDIHHNSIGILFNGGSQTVTDTVIRENSAPGSGGGIYFNATAAGTTITSTTIKNNTAIIRGGGMYFSTGAQAEFDKCTITGNEAGSGGGMYITTADASVVIKNSIIAGNIAGNGGAGTLASGAASFINDTFADNQATGTGLTGGGVFFVCSSFDNTVDNSIFWNNSAASGIGKNIYKGCAGSTGTIFTISYSDISTVHTADIYGGTVIESSGNITPAEDPLFAGSDNYHITTGSPVIDQASADYAPEDDFDGEARPNNGVDDMGADEYYAPVDSTIAGIAAADPADSSNTSIDVSMPYFYDANGNNTCTVDYKLTSAHTTVWTNWVTDADCGASPYTTTITGLTANEKYDVRMTYNDPDGVSGKAQRSVSSVDLVYYVSLTSDSQTVAEGVGSVTVTAELSRICDQPVTVPFTVSGTAEGGGTDHDLVDGDIIISAGSLTGTTTFNVIDDEFDEGSETVIVTIGTPVNATKGSTDEQTITITDNDATVDVSFTSADQTTVDESGTATIRLELSAVSGLDVTIPFTVNEASTAAGDDLDYSITESPVVIYAGDTTVDITITVAEDSLDEDNETVIIDMGTPVNANQGSTTTHTATITDDDAEPTVTFTSANQATVDESGTATITVELSAASGREVEVPFTVNVASTADGGGTDYSITASPIVIPVGYTTTDITMTIIEDSDIEGDEMVIVDMGSPTNATQGTTIQHTLTITDDEPPPVVNFTDASQDVDENMGDVTVTATLDVISNLDVTVPFTVGGTATGGGTDHDLADSNIIITAGQLTGSTTFSVNDDSLDENNETVIVIMGTPVNAAKGTTDEHTVTINDDDVTPTVQFTADSQATTDESGTATITAQLSAASGLDVTVQFTVNGASTAEEGTDYTISNSPLTITAGVTSAGITITITIDSDIEGDETVIVDMGSPTNATQGTTIQHTLTITDDDSAGGRTITVCSSGADHTTIQDAINAAASSGDTIEVCAGTYGENINYGTKNINIIAVSGAGVTKIAGDGSNTPVVTFANSAQSANAVLDGFTIDNQAGVNTLTRGISITAGAAPTLKNLTVKGNNTTTSWVDGSGIYINGGSATIETCIIGDATLQNTCEDGCGIYATGLSAPLSITGGAILENTGGSNTSGAGIALVNNGTQVTTISGVTFSNNDASDHGGALYIENSKVSISNSTIENNAVTDSGMHGGAIYSTGATSSITLTNTNFTANTTTSSGGAIYMTGSTETTPLSFTGGTFTGSGGTDALLGGAIYLGTMTNQSVIDGVTFTGLQAQKGGAIYTRGAIKIQNNSLIYSNSSTGDGGGIRVDGTNADLVIDNSSVYSNTGTIGGGIMVENSGTLTVQNGSDIYSNEAISTLGGGIYNTSSATVTVSNSLIRGNKAKQHGGGLYNAATASLTNVIVSGNTAGISTWENGGGIFNSGTLTLMNSTVAGNHGPNGGGLNNTDGTATITNSIFWDNGGTSGRKEIYNSGTFTTTVTYSDVEGGYTGTGNINLDPLFVTPAQTSSGTPTTAGDFHIQSGSPVINQGTSNGAPSDDIDGGARDANPDMGADEYGVP